MHHESTGISHSRARRVVDVRLIREALGLSREEFVCRFGLKLDMVRGWEDRTLVAVAAAVTLLRVIRAEAVRRAVSAEQSRTAAMGHKRHKTVADDQMTCAFHARHPPGSEVTLRCTATGSGDLW